MADCINDDNEIELDASTTYYSGKDPSYKKPREGEPIDGMSLSYGDLNSKDEVKGVSEIKKCNPLKIAEAVPAAEPVKCDIKSPQEEPIFAWFLNSIISLLRGEQESTGNTVAKSIIVSVTLLFILFMIYKFQLYKIAYLKSMLFTLFFLFKRFWVFALILFFLSLTYSFIFNYIPFFSKEFGKYLYLSINPFSDEGVKNTFESLSAWIIIPYVYIVIVYSYYIFLTTLIGGFIILILFPLIILFGYLVGFFLSFMTD